MSERKNGRFGARQPVGRKPRSRYFFGGIALVIIMAAIVFGYLASPPAVPTSAAEQIPSASPEPANTAKPEPSSSPRPTADAAPVDDESVRGVDGDPDAPKDLPAYGITALALLETLEVKGRAPKTGYARDEFGQPWLDVDRNGCDTRNDMLNRDLTDIIHANSVPCKVKSGVLNDPYTGRTILFLRGQDTSPEVQIDHVVALSDAWQKGARQLTFEQRVAFANDPLNLQPTDGPTNARKGAGDAATWLPPNTSYRCRYVARQISVKAAYDLWITKAERDAMARVLGKCADIMAPADQPRPEPKPEPQPVVVGDPAPPAPVPAPALEPVPALAPVPPPANVYYRNCAAVRAAGAAPIHPGQPGFQPKFDGDKDGVGCE